MYAYKPPSIDNCCPLPTHAINPPLPTPRPPHASALPLPQSQPRPQVAAVVLLREGRHFPGPVPRNVSHPSDEPDVTASAVEHVVHSKIPLTLSHAGATPHPARLTSRDLARPNLPRRLRPLPRSAFRTLPSQRNPLPPLGLLPSRRRRPPSRPQAPLTASSRAL